MDIFQYIKYVDMKSSNIKYETSMFYSDLMFNFLSNYPMAENLKRHDKEYTVIKMYRDETLTS